RRRGGHGVHHAGRRARAGDRGADRRPCGAAALAYSYDRPTSFRSESHGAGIMADLAGRIALVTGSSRGLGRAIAVALAGAGVDVAVNYRKNREQADAVVAEIRGLGRRAIAIGADVSRQDDATRLVSEAKAQLGTITILVNNAGIARVEAIDAISEQN